MPRRPANRSKRNAARRHFDLPSARRGQTLVRLPDIRDNPVVLDGAGDDGDEGSLLDLNSDIPGLHCRTGATPPGEA